MKAGAVLPRNPRRAIHWRPTPTRTGTSASFDVFAGVRFAVEGLRALSSESITAASSTSGEIPLAPEEVNLSVRSNSYAINRRNRPDDQGETPVPEGIAQGGPS